MGPRCSLIGKDRLQELRAPFTYSLWFSFPGHPPPHLFLRLCNLSSHTRCVLRAWNKLSVQEWAPLEGTFFQGTLIANPTQALDSSIFPSGSSRCKASISDPGQCQDGFTVQSQARSPGAIHLQTIWSLWDSPACAHLPTAQPYLTLWDPMDCSLSGFSAYGILQVRLLQWVAILFSRRSSQPRGWTWVSCIAGKFFTIWAAREASRF